MSINDYCIIYLGYSSSSLADLAKAEKVASGYAMTQDESQPVSDEELAADIDAMRAILGIK